MPRHSEEDLLKDLDITNIKEVKHHPENLNYTGKRNGKNVFVYIIDEDTSIPEYRYVCEIRQDDGKIIRGNGGRDSIEAILNVEFHIRELDE
jgi:hypothetical protein